MTLPNNTNGQPNAGAAEWFTVTVNKLKILEDISQRELDSVERFADSLWNKYGINVEFTRHFLDRVNDDRNGDPITVNELKALFQKEADENGVDISNMRRNEAILKDLVTYINIPFVLKKDGKQKHLVSKTVMRKKNFTSPDPVFAVPKIVKK